MSRTPALAAHETAARARMRPADRAFAERLDTAAPAEFARFANSADPGVVWAVARHPRTPGPILVKLAGRNVQCAAAVAVNRHAPPGVFARLVESNEPTVLARVARNEHAPMWVIGRLLERCDTELAAAGWDQDDIDQVRDCVTEPAAPRPNVTI